MAFSARLVSVAVAVAGGALAVGCAQTPAAPTTSTSVPKPTAAAVTAAPKPSASPAAAPSPSISASVSASPSATSGQLQLGGITYNDHGTQSVVGQSDAQMQADDFYFGPTFLRGNAGQKLAIKLDNRGKELHNLSISAQQIDKDVAPGSTTQVDVTFPGSGVLRFFCKYHAGQGMNGQLLAGDATPQSVPDQSGGY